MRCPKHKVSMMDDGSAIWCPLCASEQGVQKASSTQVGGDHYKGMLIQPAVFCEHNKLSHLESNVVKRMCRWRTKGVALKDLRKAQHEIELLIEIHGVEDWQREDE
mgnify:CR=1 FL=1